jgi:hypothetical protein
MKKFQGIGGKPHFQKTGDWDLVRQAMNIDPKEVQRIHTRSLKRAGLKAERMAVRFLRDQSLSWRPLSKLYLKWKLRKGHSEKILIQTSTYIQSITSYVIGYTAFVGVFKQTANYKDGEDVVNIAKVLEYGSRKMKIPARHLWLVVHNRLRMWIRASNFFAREIHDHFFARYRK